MKLLIKLLFCFSILMSLTINAQGGQLMISEKTIIKNAEGKKINLSQFSILMQTGDWTFQQKKDSNGNDYLQMVKATIEQKKQMLKMLSESMDEDKMVGKKAPNFSLTDVDGNIINSEKTKGKVVIMNFWFAACKPCIKEIPELNEIYDKYKEDKNVVFASVTFEKKSKIEKFEKRYPISYPVVGEARSEISKFKVSGYPTNLIIDKDGNYSFYMSGGFSGIGKHIEKAIEKTLK